MLNEIKKDAQTRMAKSVDALKHELSSIRTGRASTGLVDNLKVNYYGSDMPLNQVATVTVSDARSLTITPWEKAMVFTTPMWRASTGAARNERAAKK